MLVGEPGSTLRVAAEMARRSHAALSVCETEGALERLRRNAERLVMVDVPVDVPDVVQRLRSGESLADLCMPLVGRTVADVERALILETLAHCHGNRTSAAAMLGISVRTMRNKLRSFMEDGVAVIPAVQI